MKNVKMLLVIALLATIGQATAQSAETKMTHDQLRAAVQGICPISGQKLGSMGAPIKVKVGKETVFLCCKGCTKGKIDATHWATIHANIASAQAKCPVMDKVLPKSPKWTLVEGQIVYICCPPCADKITADPKTYLKIVDDLYAASLKVKPAAK
jgi:hypothetical protein